MNVCNFKPPRSGEPACVAEATAEIIVETVDGDFLTAACPAHLADRIAAIEEAGIWEEVADDCSIVPHVVIDVRARQPAAG